MATVLGFVSVMDVVSRAASLLSQIPDTWYRGSAEFYGFTSSLRSLEKTISQWKNQLAQFGMSDDPRLKALLEEATTILKKEEEYFQRKKNSHIWKFARRAFPGKLTSILKQIQAAVDDGPKLVAFRNQTHDDLEKDYQRRIAPLPFAPDERYVPQLDVAEEVKAALEDAGGPRVVTVYGEPGTGKSSLVKYVALAYDENCSNGPPSFFDGVVYLYVVEGGKHKIDALLKELKSNLGFDEGDGDDGSGLLTSLRRRLAQRRVLIIFDDVWEEEVLEYLIIQSPHTGGVKYLVSSQNREIYLRARKIPMKAPNSEEARTILANYTEGLPSEHDMSPDLRIEILAIMRKLENHPLAIVNVAVSIHRHRASLPSYWKCVNENLYHKLDRGPVKASMMLMIDSLNKDAGELLYVIAIMGVAVIPDVVLRVFYKALRPCEHRERFDDLIKYLDDRSLIRLRRSWQSRTGLLIGGDSNEVSEQFFIEIHRMRAHFLRAYRKKNLMQIASGLVDDSSKSPHGDSRSSCTLEKDLAVILGAMYSENTFSDNLVPKFRSLVNSTRRNDLIPSRVDDKVDVMQLVGTFKSWICNIIRYSGAIELLYPHEERGWKQQSHHYATKLIIQMAYKGEFDDEAMAGLLRIPQTSFAACEILVTWYDFSDTEIDEKFYAGQHQPFSITHPETMGALVNLWKNSLPSTSRAAVIWASGSVMKFDKESNILILMDEWMSVVSKFPDLQDVIVKALADLHAWRVQSRITDLIPEVWEFLLTSIERLLKSDDDRVEDIFELITKDSGYAQKTLASPDILRMWMTDASMFRALLRRASGYFGQLSEIPDFRSRFVEIQEFVEDFTCWPESYSGLTAGLWGNIALAKNLTELTKSRLLRISRRWLTRLEKADELPVCFCACNCTAESCASNPDCNDGNKAWASLVDLSANFCARDSTSVPCDIKRWPNVCGDTGGIRKVASTLTIINESMQCNGSADKIKVAGLFNYPGQRYDAWAGQADAHRKMKLYAEAVEDLESARDHLNAKEPLSYTRPRQREEDLEMTYWCHIMMVKALATDYSGAMEVMEARWPQYTRSNLYSLGERGVLRRLSREYAQAIEDFDQAIMEGKGRYGRYFKLHNYKLFLHRGLAKHLSGDEKGAKEDATSAQLLKANALFVEPVANEFPQWPMSQLFIGSTMVYRFEPTYYFLDFPVECYTFL